MKKRILRNWRLALFDVVCWVYLAFLLYNKDFMWAAVWMLSGLVLNRIFYMYPQQRMMRVMRN